jgi:tetratricopeptide (TPR) repeat protein
VGLQATYTATVDGKVIGAFRAARRAYDAHEQVLERAPARKEAGLTVGMYRYIISAMSMPVRMLAYVAGFGGDKDLGIRMVEEAAATKTDVAGEAQFALVLLYNREARYADALRVLRELQRAYPRNRILWLEAGATALRAGRPADAEQMLATGMRMLDADTRPRMAGEDALWLLKRGTARVALDRLPDAEADLKRVFGLESRRWVTGRAHAELGKIADLRGDRRTARAEFQRAVAIADQESDPVGAADARRWVGTPFTRDR